MGKFYQCIQSYGPSFMTKFCSALYLENLLTNIFAKLNLRGGVSCMPAALFFFNYVLRLFQDCFGSYEMGQSDSRWAKTGEPQEKPPGTATSRTWLGRLMHRYMTK